MGLDEELWLTNNFLFITNFTAYSQNFGCLVIPTKIGQSNCTLIFGVSNDSTTTVEFVNVILSASPNFHFNVESGWFPAYSGAKTESLQKGSVSTNEIQEWGYSPPFTLVPRTGNELSPIEVDIPDESSGWPLLQISIKAKDSPDLVVRFGISFIRIKTTNSFRPFMVLENNQTNGTQWISWVEVSNNILKQIEK